MCKENAYNQITSKNLQNLYIDIVDVHEISFSGILLVCCDCDLWWDLMHHSEGVHGDTETTNHVSEVLMIAYGKK